MPFTCTNLHVAGSDGQHWTLLEPFAYVTAVFPGELRKLVVPAVTQFDGASTPRSIWHLIPPFGVYWRAACLHDHLYRNTTMRREDADAVFLEAMVALGVDQVTRETIYAAVRVAGEHAFEEDRNTSPAPAA